MLINLTPHALTLYSPTTSDVLADPAEGVLAIWPVAGVPVRCAETRQDAGTITVTTPDGARVDVPVSDVGFGAISALPDPRPGVVYAVSRATAERADGRFDVVYPDRLVYSPAGRTLGCRAFARVPQEEPEIYDDYTLADPRGILRGERWENHLDGVTVAIHPPRLYERLGTIYMTVSGTSVHLDGGSSEQMAEALGYARARAAAQPCPRCPEVGEPITPDAAMWRCLNGHTFNPEIELQQLRPCQSCGGYGVR
ncbi:hypothetical protein AB0D67_36735 [Streptosporangium sp. NPDC048047]|uniref:hypothetical protein n=1 Tax=Streptosporangium sp. NPDC048047 TaxID=3155748 RepID=UPI00344A117B